MKTKPFKTKRISCTLTIINNSFITLSIDKCETKRYVCGGILMHLLSTVDTTPLPPFSGKQRRAMAKRDRNIEILALQILKQAT